MSCCRSCEKKGPCTGAKTCGCPLPCKHPVTPPAPARQMPDYEGFPKYPYATLSPAPFGRSYTTSFDMDHNHTVEIPDSAFGAVGPNFRRNVHMVTEALGVAVAAPMLWWASGQTNNPRARAALRALAIGMGATDAALLASYGYDAYQGRG